MTDHEVETGVREVRLDTARTSADVRITTGASTSVRRRLVTERLLTDLAIECAEAPVARLHRLLTDFVSAFGEALDLDGCLACLPPLDNDLGIQPAYHWSRPSETRAPGVLRASDLPWLSTRTGEGATVSATTLDELPDAADRAALHRLGARSCAAVPIGLRGARGALIVYSTMSTSWPDELSEVLRLAGAIVGLAVGRVAGRREPDPVGAPAVVVPNVISAVVRRDSPQVRGEGSLASSSAAVRHSLELAKQVASTSATVLLLGETGVGKEVFAETIHDLSPRRSRPMIKVNCAALPATLLENELFGHERGAFTDAWGRQIGRFEAAHGSTILLDEIGELPREMQVKLLRVLQERTIERIGGTQPLRVDVRIIAATNCDLTEAVKTGSFREDLFYRLNVFPIHVPPLRERAADIPTLVWAFVDELSEGLGRKIEGIASSSFDALQKYHWPGNVRELRNLVERAMIQTKGPLLTIPVPAARTPDQAGAAGLNGHSHPASTPFRRGTHSTRADRRITALGVPPDDMGLSMAAPLSPS